MELLTNSGWRSSNDIESILIQIRFTLLFLATSAFIHRIEPKCRKEAPALRVTLHTTNQRYDTKT